MEQAPLKERSEGRAQWKKGAYGMTKIGQSAFRQLGILW